ncbi:MAG: DUF1015 domain-containing protein [Alphaproteobacteria bacterium]|nr:DUF1015 domain-containing protein [Alphaproteobacteria bacterium]
MTALPLFRPFAALRPTRAQAAAVAAPPYDVLDSQEARTRAQGRPWSFLHISKAEIDLPPGTDPHAPEVYAKAAENLRRMVAEGVIVRESQACYYVYRLVSGAHVQTGVVAAASVAAYDSQRIRRHEFTRPDKEDDRVRQIEAVDAHTGPVLAAFRPLPEVARVLERTTGAAPEFSVTADDGIEHTLWIVSERDDIARLTAAFDGVDALYIADGHHRSAAASRVAAARRTANPAHRGDEPYNSFLIVAFPAAEMLIMDYNRVVRDLNGLSPEAFLDRIGGDFSVTPSDGPAKPSRYGEMGLYLRGRWYRLGVRDLPAADADPVDRLDVSLLTDRLLAPVLGIEDLRKDKRIDFVGGARGLAELERRVDSGEMAAAFALHPTSMDDLIAVTEAGKVMPPKSTWFEPKLADGLVSLPLD